MPIIAVPVNPGATTYTFLDLVRRLAVECGITKNAVLSLPTIVGATQEAGRLVGWIVTAWRDIQSLHPNWAFLRRSTSFATVDGQATYTPVQAGLVEGTLGKWKLDSFRNYKTSAGTNGEIFMADMDYEVWRDTYQYGALRNAKSQPFVVAETPEHYLGLGPVPLAGYTVLGDYYLAPVDLQSDSELTTLPTWHNPMIVVYSAMRMYGAFEAAPEIYQRGETEYKKLLGRLQLDQLPRVYMGGPLC